jgi:hypothetical protein
MEEDENHRNTFAAFSCADFAAAFWTASQVRIHKKMKRDSESLFFLQL